MMHPILTQALAAERVREWHDQAARHQLVKQARRARHESTPAAAELPGPRPGSPRPAPRTAVPVTVASRQPAPLAGGQPGADRGPPPAGGRAPGHKVATEPPG